MHKTDYTSKLKVSQYMYIEIEICYVSICHKNTSFIISAIELLFSGRISEKSYRKASDEIFQIFRNVSTCMTVYNKVRAKFWNLIVCELKSCFDLLGFVPQCLIFQ